MKALLGLLPSNAIICVALQRKAEQRHHKLRHIIKTCMVAVEILISLTTNNFLSVTSNDLNFGVQVSAPEEDDNPCCIVGQEPKPTVQYFNNLSTKQSLYCF